MSFFSRGTKGCLTPLYRVAVIMIYKKYYNSSMTIKCITLNIWRGELLRDVIVFLQQEKPAILFLQEAMDETHSKLPENMRMLEVLQKEAGFEYKAFAPTLAQDGIQEGNAILSTFPLKPKNVQFFDIPYNPKYVDSAENWPWCPGNIQHVEANVNGITLNLFNTHGIWGEHGDDTDRRFYMSNIIIEAIQREEHVILAGDFNLKPHTQAVKSIEKHVENVFKEELSSTFNMKRKTNPGYATAVVDMMFVSKTIRVIEKRCPQVDVSDHLPLVCMLEIFE